MKHNVRLIPLALLAGSLSLVGCPNGTTGPSTSASPAAAATPAATPTPLSTQPKDYFYPMSANYTAVYDGTQSVTWSPNSGQTNQLSTGSMTFQVSSYTPTQCQLNTQFTGWPSGNLPQNANGSLQSTASIVLRSDGSVVNNQGSDATTVETYGAGIFTTAGAIITPASGSPGATGSTPATRVALVGTENVTVPAGTFNSMKFAQTADGMPDLTPMYFWYAPGTGPVRMLASQPVSISGPTLTATGSFVLEYKLRSITR